MLSSRRALTVLLCAVAASSLAACGQATQVGAAAVVGNERITVSELQREVREVAEEAPGGGEATGDQSAVQQNILQRLIQHYLLEELAREEGVEVTAAEIDTFVEEQIIAQAPDGDIGPLLAQNSLTERTMRRAVRDQLIAEKLIDELGGNQQLVQLLTEKSEELGVTVSPRYGSWDGIMLDVSSGSISTPAARPAETPTG
ncbi:MAG: SurA N-terminal domain-containing protein [Jiangellaceae bacterium]|nr:SurA N-terminal domain-containing protein [Jiangellaceae bacterium]